MKNNENELLIEKKKLLKNDMYTRVSIVSHTVFRAPSATICDHQQYRRREVDWMESFAWM